MGELDGAGGHRVLASAMAVAVAVVLTTTACTGSDSDDHAGSVTPSASSSPSGVVGLSVIPAPTRAQCRAKPHPAPGVAGMQEIGGKGLFGLLFTAYPIKARTEAKIAWRVGDEPRPGSFWAMGPGRAHLEPVWGPEEHMGSNWNRAGSEWGTGFRFPSPGCWQVVVTTDSGVETAAVRVV